MSHYALKKTIELFQKNLTASGSIASIVEETPSFENNIDQHGEILQNT